MVLEVMYLTYHLLLEIHCTSLLRFVRVFALFFWFFLAIPWGAVVDTSPQVLLGWMQPQGTMSNTMWDQGRGALITRRSIPCSMLFR